jgi:RNA polymerase sigma-70 factor (ECF subfamily)
LAHDCLPGIVSRHSQSFIASWAGFLARNLSEFLRCLKFLARIRSKTRFTLRMSEQREGPRPADVPTRASLLGRLRGNGSQDATVWEQSWLEFDQLYRPVLQRYARSRGVAEHEADDLCQNILIAVRKAMDTFEYNPSRCRFQSWLFTVARNHIVSHLRRGSRGTVLVAGEEALMAEVPDPGPCPDEVWQSEFDKSLARFAWESVRLTANPEYVRIYRKHVLEGCSVAETVKHFRDPAVTAESVYTAKNRIARVLAETVRNLRRNPLFL